MAPATNQKSRSAAAPPATKDTVHQVADQLKDIKANVDSYMKNMLSNGTYPDYLKSMAANPRFSVRNLAQMARTKPGQEMKAAGLWKHEHQREVKAAERDNGTPIVMPKVIRYEMRDVPKKINGKQVIDENYKKVFEQKSIPIFEFQVATLYDRSQLDGPPLPGPEKPSGEHLLKAMANVALDGELDGVLTENEAKAIRAQNEAIIKNTDLTEGQKLSEMVRHCVEPTYTNEKGVADLRGQFHMESIAAAVCSHYDKDSAIDFSKFAGVFDKDLKGLEGELGSIKSAVHKITDKLENSLQAITKEQAQAQAKPAEKEGTQAKSTPAKKSSTPKKEKAPAKKAKAPAKPSTTSKLEAATKKSKETAKQKTPKTPKATKTPEVSL